MNRLSLALAIWLLFGFICLISEYAHAGEKPIPPGLQRVMAEGAGRVANMTCADVRAVVAVYGAWKAEAVARASGATEHQIREAKRCLKSSSR